ncbi:MAG: DUF2523 domain-containing protein [Burkholderiales bacterium]|jgi:hypothetical protein|nr:DUF2523 domain-containing protein [Burkholderiales bacterium]
MPAFLISFLAFLAPVLKSVAGQILASLGVGFISYMGVSALTDSMFAYVQGNMAGIPYASVQFLYMFKLLTCINMILSAYVGKFVVSGAKKLIFS